MRKARLIASVATLAAWLGFALLAPSCNLGEGKPPAAPAAQRGAAGDAQANASGKEAPREASGIATGTSARVDDLMEAMLTIDGVPYSEEAVRSFIVTYGYGPHGTKGIEKTVDDFIDRELALRDMTDRGWTRKKEYSRQLRIFYLSSLGVDFMLHHLDAKIPVSAEEIQRALPVKFRMGNFDLLRFETEEEAREALKAIRTESEFAHYAREHPDQLKNTGELFPSTGFFHAFDDVGLFNRKSGEVAGYLETGIGPAIVAVREVRDLTSAEIEQIVEKERKAARDRKKPNLIRSLEEKHRIRKERKRVYELAEKELREGIGTVHDGVVASVDDLRISYRNLRAWINRDYIGSLGSVSEEDLGRFMYNDLENLVKQVALGMEAETEGVKLADENYRKAFEELTKRYSYLVAITEWAGGEIRVTDGEVKRYYEEYRETKFTEAEKVKAGHIFTRRLKKAQDIEKKLKAGELFEEAAKKYSDEKDAQENEGNLGYVLNTPAIHPNVRKGLFGSSVPDNTVTGIVDSDTGYHIFKIYKHFPRRRIPFSVAAPGIRKTLKFERFEGARKRYAEELRKKHSVVRNEKKIQAMMEEMERESKRARSTHMPH